MPKPSRKKIRRLEIRRLRRDYTRFTVGCATHGRFSILMAYWGCLQYRALVCFRLWRILNIPVIRRLMYLLYRHYSRRSGVELSPPIGGGLIMPHWGRIVIDAVSVGEDLYVLHNVTVGSDYATGRPTLGNDVFIGTGAVVIGNIRIGDHVVIAAGSVVREDVPDCSLVAGNPARRIRAIAPDAIRAMTHY